MLSKKKQCLILCWIWPHELLRVQQYSASILKCHFKLFTLVITDYTEDVTEKVKSKQNEFPMTLHSIAWYEFKYYSPFRNSFLFYDFSKKYSLIFTSLNSSHCMLAPEMYLLSIFHIKTCKIPFFLRGLFISVFDQESHNCHPSFTFFYWNLMFEYWLEVGWILGEVYSKSIYFSVLE